MSVPLAAKTVTNGFWYSSVSATDNGYPAGFSGVVITSGGTTMAFDKGGSTLDWTNSGGKRASFQMFYEI